MKLKFVVAIVCFFTSFMCCFAQNVEDSALYFTASTINYGTIAEDGGVVTAYVDAINRGDTPIYIEDIITTCGCTKADYPREAINPNQTIRIGISFDPMNRPGRIERKVMVVASDSEKHTILNMVVKYLKEQWKKEIVIIQIISYFICYIQLFQMEYVH